MARERLDKLVTDRGLAASRERARALIMSGSVRVGDRVETKPGTLVDAGVEIVVTAPDHPYVSRGALKLEKGLDAFSMAWLPATFSSLTLLIQPVVAAMLAWVFLNEPLTVAQAAGGSIVIAGIVLARRGAT